ncbi:MAG: proline--tRNA ligase [Phycisphaerales bacterium]|nr:MAG: proline--tRNA ligase [Phycisphaerales bacterium]
MMGYSSAMDTVIVMPALWSRAFIPTLRQVPAEAEIASHQLMLRAGLIRQLGSGLHSYLPAGWRALSKVAGIVRREMDAMGASELHTPAITPRGLLQETGRDDESDEELFRLKDRFGRQSVLGPAPEEVITDLARYCVQSHRQLPLLVYRIQGRCCDEERPRAGVLRGRESQVMDACSFHLATDGEGGLEQTCESMRAAFRRIFDRCGLRCETVRAAGGTDQTASHEFHFACEAGEDTIFRSQSGGYLANTEACGIGERAWTLDSPPTGELAEVHTPDLPGVEEVAAFLKIRPAQMLKTLVCRGDDGWIVAVVRGDHELNLHKLRNAVGGEVALADDEEAGKAGFAIGFVSPSVIRSADVAKLVIDPDAAQEGFWASGANRMDYHVRHFNWRREVGDALEPDRVRVADIRNAVDEDPSPTDDGTALRAVKGITLGRVHNAGRKCAEAMKFLVLDEQQRQRPPHMGCYSIAIERLIAGVIESSHDDDGIIWPALIAPWQVHTVPIKFEGEVREVAARLAGELEAAGADVVIDDRAERPGVKFADADLLGCPVRITIGDKTLAEGCVEIKRRIDGRAKGELVPVDEASRRCRELLNQLAPATIGDGLSEI